jgi:hypothetical protein
MTTITVTSPDPAVAAAALTRALEQYGPPVTIIRPGHPDLTVACTTDEMHARLAAFWGQLFKARIRTAPQDATEQSVRHARPNVACLVASSGAVGDAAAGTPFLLVSAVGVTPVAPTAWEALDGLRSTASEAVSREEVARV